MRYCHGNGCIITGCGLIVLPLQNQPNENNWLAGEKKLCLNLNSKKKLLKKKKVEREIHTLEKATLFQLNYDV